MKNRFKLTPRKTNLRGNSVAVISAVVVAGSAAYGAYSSSQASSKAQKAAENQNAIQAQGVAGQQAALQQLYANQKQPDEIFKSIFTSMPGMLDQVLPTLRKQSVATANQFTDSNIAGYNHTLSTLYPEYAAQAGRRLSLINEEDPANLGQTELSEMSKKLAAFIPTGSVNPNTGAVGAGLSSPSAMYRNAISGAYQQRRTQFMGDNNAWLADAQNAAGRQQEKASSFFGGFLNLASGNAANLSQLGTQQQASNIGAQTSLLQTLMSMPRAQFNPAPFQQATSQGIGQGVNGLLMALKGINTPSSTSAGYGVSGNGDASLATSYSPTESYVSNYQDFTGGQMAF